MSFLSFNYSLSKNKTKGVQHYLIIKCVVKLNLKTMNIKATEVNKIPKTNIGAIKFNGRIMVWQNLIEQYCYLPGF